MLLVTNPDARTGTASGPIVGPVVSVSPTGAPNANRDDARTANHSVVSRVPVPRTTVRDHSAGSTDEPHRRTSLTCGA